MISLNIKIYDNLSEEQVINQAIKKNRINNKDIIEAKISKRSVDARDKKNIYFNYTILVKVKDEKKYPKLKKIEEKVIPEIKVRHSHTYRPIIVGAGPAGLFCALTLVNHGYKPIILEQGSCVEKRKEDIEMFKKYRKVNTMSNVQFGEGGAGTFSDGKLTTGISSYHIQSVLEHFVKFGAPKEIMYVNKPHIGTDYLLIVLKNMRDYITSKGGTYYFDTKFEDFVSHEDYVHITCSNGLEFDTDALVLAIGHSARDTYKLLVEKNMEMKRKNFSVGVRIEHPQSLINVSQYGTYTKLQLPQAEYKLAYHGNERSCYSFCMCPGGEVVASAVEEGTIVTNGMSYYKRDKENANSALLVNVLTTDFEGDDPLAGMYFQEELERKAYILGGSNYNAPIQRVEDFLCNRPSTSIGTIQPSYKPGVTPANLHDILPEFVGETLKEGIVYFDKKIKGFAHPDALLTGVETRSSAPITIIRDENLVSSIPYIYPCGEGAGMAGGITSAAIDGIKVAIKILEL